MVIFVLDYISTNASEDHMQWCVFPAGYYQEAKSLPSLFAFRASVSVFDSQNLTKKLQANPNLIYHSYIWKLFKSTLLKYFCHHYKLHEHPTHIMHTGE